jgi:protein-disulfide isomerase
MGSFFLNPRAGVIIIEFLEILPMSENRSDRKDARTEEPFLLSVLPFAGLVLLLAVALAWRFLERDGATTTAPSDPTQAVIDRWEKAPVEEVETTSDDFAVGPTDAPITIVEFSDFECPFCRTGAQAAKDVIERYPESVRVIFKNLPLDTACNEQMTQQLHPFACRAALMARCAGESDPELFWRTHDAFFRASGLSENVLEQIANEVPLDRKELEACIASPAQVDKVKSDVAAARELGVTGTPTFFLNGRRVADYRDGLLGRLVEHVLGSVAGS